MVEMENMISLSFFTTNQRKPVFLPLRFMGSILIFCFFLSLLSRISPTDGYDPLDPKGNITIKWDILAPPLDTYDALVSIYNFQLFRHIERPGWRLSWTWREKEVIWSMLGAEATEQGDCSRVKVQEPPHSCEKQPVIIDYLPGTPYNVQTANCCKGGVLSSMTQDPNKYGASFQMNVGMIPPGNYSNNLNDSNGLIPVNFSLGIPGYTCGTPFNVMASRFSHDNGRRWTQAFKTWNVTCSYSQFQASTAPTCCVSLSSFYHQTITPCPQCSCRCQGEPGSKCIKDGESPSLLQLPHKEDEVLPPLVTCSRHMCPIRVHWHVKTSYKDYWRVKVTVNNFNFVKNYTMWTLVVQHPNLQSVNQVFSFNYKPLNQYGPINDTGMFWGIQYYNDILLQSGPDGNVQTEILLRKDKEIFTFREGWAFPRKISFNGDQCVMPPPDEYPRLPNGGPTYALTSPCMMLSLSLLLPLMSFLY